MMDLGTNTQLEKFHMGKDIFPDVISKDYPFLLPKTKTLIIAETGVQSACLYKSLAEWLYKEDDVYSILSLPDYNREWYHLNGNEYRNRKLTHTVGMKSWLALQLRNAINSEIVQNSNVLFDTFTGEMIGDEYKDAQV